MSKRHVDLDVSMTQDNRNEMNLSEAHVNLHELRLSFRSLEILRLFYHQIFDVLQSLAVLGDSQLPGNQAI